MANGHGGRRLGAGRKRKQQPQEHQPPVRSDRVRLKAAALEQQRARAIAGGRLETAARIDAKRLEFLPEDL
jgi:hypothetical protein